MHAAALKPLCVRPAFPRPARSKLDENPSLCGPVPDALHPAVCERGQLGTQCVGAELPACTAAFPPASDADAAALLAQRDAIANWAAFAAANNVSGWAVPGPPVCNWTGVSCTPGGSVVRL